MFEPPTQNPNVSPDSSRPSEEEATQLIVYGTTWCSDCHRSRRFLNQHQVRYHWVDIENDASAAARVVAINHGSMSVPTFVFPDGTTLTEPSNRELARKLGIA